MRITGAAAMTVLLSRTSPRPPMHRIVHRSELAAVPPPVGNRRPARLRTSHRAGRNLASIRSRTERGNEGHERESGSEAKSFETGHDPNEQSKKGGSDGNCAALRRFSAINFSGQITEAEETPHCVSRKVRRWCPQRHREQRARFG